MIQKLDGAAGEEREEEERGARRITHDTLEYGRA